MTAQPDDSHRLWEELVAGHALHALEPADELRLLAHVDACPSCPERLDEFALVAAQLGALAHDESRPPGWAEIRERLVVPPPATTSRTTVTRMPVRRPLASRILAAAAAVTIVGAAVVVSVRLESGQPATGIAALTACRQQTGCEVIQLHGSRGDTAAVLVDAGRASIVPIKMPVAPAGRMYVLWQLPRDGSPIPVVTFGGGIRQTSSVPLVTGYDDTAAFAVSLEPAGPMPTRPTDVVAVGAATS